MKKPLGGYGPEPTPVNSISQEESFQKRWSRREVILRGRGLSWGFHGGSEGVTGLGLGDAAASLCADPRRPRISSSHSQNSLPLPGWIVFAVTARDSKDSCPTSNQVACSGPTGKLGFYPQIPPLRYAPVGMTIHF